MQIEDYGRKPKKLKESLFSKQKKLEEEKERCIKFKGAKNYANSEKD